MDNEQNENPQNKIAEKISVESSLGRQAKAARKKSYTIDLKISSPASLGYIGVHGLDTAPALVRLAKVKGLDMIGITDFFSGEYVNRVKEAAKGSNIAVIPGVDIRCALHGCDDVILTCLFAETAQTEDIRKFLAELEIPEKAYGNHSFVIQKSFDFIIATIEKYSGICLPSRMDKTPYRMQAISSLVEEYGFRAFDLAYPDSSRMFKKYWPKIKFQLFGFSDAKALAQIGSRTARVKVLRPDFEALKVLLSRAPRETEKHKM